MPTSIETTAHDAAAFLLDRVRGEDFGVQHWLDLACVNRPQWDKAMRAKVGDALEQMVALPVWQYAPAGRPKRRRYVA
jgi:hypothetical protein